MEKNTTNYGRTAMPVGTADFVLIPAYVLAIVIGFCGNILVLLVVKKKRSMHTTTNYLLANLAVADLLTLTWCIPGLVMNFVPHPQGVLGDLLCKFVTMHHIAGISIQVSGLTLTILAVERYKALFYPLTTRLTLTKHNVRYPIICVWIFSVAFVIPLFVSERYNNEMTACEIYWNAQNQALASAVYWGTLSGIATLSFIIILFCYFNIIRGLYFTKTICSGGSTDQNSQNEGTEKRKIVKLLLTVTVVFFVCFIPFCLVSTVLLDTRYAVVYKLSYFLVYFSSSLNPFIYAFHSSNYREAYHSIILNMTKTLHCKWPKKLSSRAARKKRMSDLEIQATYHASNEMAVHTAQTNQAKLLSFKRLEK